MTTTTSPAASVPTQRNRRRAERPAPPQPWCCDNCAQPNAGRRRRCVDCGTLRW